MVFETFKLEIRKWGKNNSDILENWFPPELRSPPFNLWKYEASEKGAPESCTIHSNLMNDEELGYSNFLKLKYRRRDQIIQTLLRIGVPRN